MHPAPDTADFLKYFILILLWAGFCLPFCVVVFVLVVWKVIIFLLVKCAQRSQRVYDNKTQVNSNAQKCCLHTEAETKSKQV